jgi:hypothetical protein
VKVCEVSECGSGQNDKKGRVIEGSVTGKNDYRVRTRSHMLQGNACRALCRWATGERGLGSMHKRRTKCEQAVRQVSQFNEQQSIYNRPVVNCFNLSLHQS